MAVFSNLIKGALSVITVTASPQLYRYPYRTSAEGLRGDMQRIGGDIGAVIGKLDQFKRGMTDGRRTKRKH